MPQISVIIPCKNEENNITETVNAIKMALDSAHINFEIIVVNDGSTDNTQNVINHLSQLDPRVKLLVNEYVHGFGYAIRLGLSHFEGDYAIIAMGDGSDDPLDIVRYFKTVSEGFDCCFGQRWCRKSVVKDYPAHKYFLNRVINWVICFLFRIDYSDVTNAFKCYSKETIDGIKPLISRHFNMTVELPLKAIVRGYSYSVIPTNWYNRKSGISKLKIDEMGGRYIFIILYVLLEKLLCKNDYKR